MGYRAWYWRIYNVLRRLIGLWFCLIGFLALLSPMWQRLGLMDGPPMTGGEIITGTVVWGFGIVFGLFLCRRLPFRPDLGDWLWHDYFIAGRVRPSKAERQARSWWTGNPRNAVKSRDRDA